MISNSFINFEEYRDILYALSNKMFLLKILINYTKYFEEEV